VKRGERIERGSYTEVAYAQFTPRRGVNLARAVCGVLSWPLTWPLAMCCRWSDTLFRTTSELLSLLPYAVGIVIRGEFYRFALERCGRNIVIESGTVFLYRDVELGSNVLLGRYNTIHHCDFGSNVLIAEFCAFLSGARYHNHARLDVPMSLQGGKKTRIKVADDTWIGAHAVVMADVGTGAIVGAGSVVTRPVPSHTVVAGNPARVLRRRGTAPDDRPPVPQPRAEPS
jgi:acetyltransferase-like isoleucine patch superfamily enzyme